MLRKPSGTYTAPVLDRSFRLTFRNFSTIFFIVAVVTVPLHLAYGYFSRDVVALSEIHDEIENLPQDQKVKGVGADDLERARAGGWAVAAVEVALLPFLAAAARRVVEADRKGEIPYVTTAWAAALRRPLSGIRRLPSTSAAPLFAALGFALAVALLARAGGLLATEPVPNDLAWAGVGLVEGAARALGAGFFLVPLVLASSPKGPQGETPTLY